VTYKVAQWATGNLGTLAVQSILKHPELELIGTWVSSPEKAGRDVGELCGLAPIGLIATVSGMSFEIKGIVDGGARIVVEHITKLRREDFPEHGLDDVYRVIIEGEPHIKIDMRLRSDFGDTTHAGYIVAVTPVTNAIPAVCEAPAGVLTYLDLPPHGACGLLRSGSESESSDVFAR
jgi:hypothetical protein